MPGRNAKLLSDRVYEAGFKYEKEHGGCAMAVIAAIQDVFRLCDGCVFKGATGLSGGIGGMGSVCGALTGGIIALGLRWGEERSAWEKRLISEKEWKSKVYVYERMSARNKAHLLAEELYRRFEEEYGGVLCRDIQKRVFGKSFNLHDQTDVEEFNKAGAHVNKCPRVVGTAARWVAEMLLREER